QTRLPHTDVSDDTDHLAGAPPGAKARLAQHVEFRGSADEAHGALCDGRVRSAQDQPPATLILTSLLENETPSQEWYGGAPPPNPSLSRVDQVAAFPSTRI